MGVVTARGTAGRGLSEPDAKDGISDGGTGVEGSAAEGIGVSGGGRETVSWRGDVLLRVARRFLQSCWIWLAIRRMGA